MEIHKSGAGSEYQHAGADRFSLQGIGIKAVKGACRHNGIFSGMIRFGRITSLFGINGNDFDTGF